MRVCLTSISIGASRTPCYCDLVLITLRINLQVRTVKMLAQAVCSMTVCPNAAAGVNCMWASSYDGELSSWVIDELCVCSSCPIFDRALCDVLNINNNNTNCMFVGSRTNILAQGSERQHRTRNPGILWSLPTALARFQWTSRMTPHASCNSPPSYSNRDCRLHYECAALTIVSSVAANMVWCRVIKTEHQ
jgi:hypothetical protein